MKKRKRDFLIYLVGRCILAAFLLTILRPTIYISFKNNKIICSLYFIIISEDRAAFSLFVPWVFRCHSFPCMKITFNCVCFWFICLCCLVPRGHWMERFKLSDVAKGSCVWTLRYWERGQRCYNVLSVLHRTVKCNRFRWVIFIFSLFFFVILCYVIVIFFVNVWMQ